MSKSIRKTDKKVAAKGKPTAESPAVRTGPTYRGRPIRREFNVTVVDEFYCRESGFGLTLDKVLDQLVDEFVKYRSIDVRDREVLKGQTGGGASDEVCAEYALEHEDQVVWEGNRVLAVVRVDGQGHYLEVVRFDGEDTAPTGRTRVDGREYDEDDMAEDEDD
jgi:hypothetical protein